MRKLSGSLCKMLLLISFILIYSGCYKNDDIRNRIPLSPSTLVATSLSETQISLTWQDNASNETGFKIERKTDSTSFTLITTLSADKVLFVDSNLQANTTYHYQVYAYSSAGNSTPFSNIASVKTLNKKVAPILSTTKVDSILFDKAMSGGSVMSDGNSPILERGVVWDISPNPTINLTTKTVEGPESGTFKSYVKNLAANTTYYLRAYATNNIGTAYGNQETFTTKSLLILATFTDTTVDVTPDITSASVYVFALKSVGTGPITSRGVVWSTSPGPTVDLPTKINIGTITGSYWTELDNLTARTKYFIREYAINAAGTVYGRESSFMTLYDVNSVQVGDDFQGGVVFYILQPSDLGYSSTVRHGLIASKNNNSVGFTWNKNTGTILVGGTDSIIGSGNSNTIRIASVLGSGTYAAKFCADKVENSYGDWFLPSKAELNLMYNNIGKGAPAPLTNLGGFQNLPYWSSTEFDNLNAYFQNFGTGATGSTAAKLDAYLVRAIRKF